MQIEKIKIGNVNQATIADREKINEIIDYLSVQEYKKLPVSGIQLHIEFILDQLLSDYEGGEPISFIKRNYANQIGQKM